MFVGLHIPGLHINECRRSPKFLIQVEAIVSGIGGGFGLLVLSVYFLHIYIGHQWRCSSPSAIIAAVNGGTAYIN